jgi:hypothetical protein
MTRETLLQIYTTEENKERLKETADAVDQSLSEYGHHLIEQHLASLSETEEPDRLGTERTVVDILTDLHEDVTAELSEFRSETADDLLYVHSVRTAYLIALWKLLEGEHSAPERRYAMRFAAAHVGVEPTVLEQDGPPDPEISDGVPTEDLAPALSTVVEVLGDD